MPSIQFYLKTISICAFIGILLSLYMTFDHFFPSSHKSFCDFNSVFSCSTLLKSKYAKIFSIPIALLGFIWNTILFYFSKNLNNNFNFFELKKINLEKTNFSYYYLCCWIWILFGVGFIVYLILIELYLNKICPLCTIIHILILICLFSMFKIKKQYNNNNNNDEKKKNRNLNNFFRIFLEREKLKLIALSIAMLILIFVLKRNESQMNGVSNENSKQAILTTKTLIDCFERENIVMFGSASCPVCQIQFQYFKFENETERVAEKAKFYVDCLERKELCKQLEISKVPIWVKFNNENNVVDKNEWLTKENKLELKKGIQSLDELKKFSQCQY